MRFKVMLTLALLAAAALANADAELQSFLEQTLAAARDKAKLPAVAALVQISGKIEAEAALGVRALGHDEPVTTGDRWHVGSDTKAFTSMMIARLVEQHVMSFDDTLAKSFPAFAKQMDPAYRNVTVTQLLSHTAGLPTLTDDKDLPEFLDVLKTVNGVKAQRTAVARYYLTKPPASKTGEFAYSNTGFIIAGAIAEVHAGKTWEALIRQQVCAPLGIKHAGFGAPGTSGKFDEPLGHLDTAGTLAPLDPKATESDNPPALGPAGTINITLRDWMLFAQDQLDGVHGHGKLLKPETYRRLHTPVTGNYALGWGAKLDDDGTPALLTHTGSNGFWVADIRIMPKHDMIFLVVTNAGNETAEGAVKEIGKALRDRLKPFE
ncbi:MAG: serine hydrolase domain-containing protein [Steroidobacterales bacterium]